MNILAKFIARINKIDLPSLNKLILIYVELLRVRNVSTEREI